MLPLSLAVLLAAPPALRVVGDPPAAVEATAIAAPADPAAALTVRLADAPADRPAMLGTHTFKAGVLRFEPRFPFAPGVRYRATLNVPDAPPPVEFTVPKPKAVPPTVLLVTPSGPAVPENALRFYVRFSKPMSWGGVYEFVKLVNETDRKPVDLPFLELGEELWTPDGTRLTLLIDPGRVKREVKPREDLGPALSAGNRYALEVAAGVPDADGTAMAAAFRQRFTAGPPDREPIDPTKWTLAPPAAGPGRLVVKLGKPLDAGLLHRLVWVTDAAGGRLDGTVTVFDREAAWAFEPATRWAAGRYRLVIDTRLEDVCGNRVGESFEADLSRPGPRAERPRTVTVPFDVR
jgi:hypothetical protein